MTTQNVPMDTDIYQVDDGTIFYHQHEPTVRLYVKWKGNEIEAEIPEYVHDVNVIDNAIFFTSEKQIFKTTFVPPNAIDVCCQRNITKDERERGCGWPGLIRSRNDNTYVYRLCDNPDKDGILVHVPPQFSDAELGAIHRGRALFVSCRNWVTPSVYKLSDKVFMIEVPIKNGNVSCFAQNSSHFFYIRVYERLFVLNTNTMEFLPSLHIDEKYIKIRGVVKGIIILITKFCTSFLAVQLPIGYYANVNEIDSERNNNENLKMTGNDVKTEKVLELERKISEHIMTIEKLSHELNETEKRLAECGLQNKQLVKENKGLSKSIAMTQTDLKDSIEKSKEKAAEDEIRIQHLVTENEIMRHKLNETNKTLSESKYWALSSVKLSLRFEELEKLTKLLVVIQLENGPILYFDNAKPFELYYLNGGTQVKADLKLLEGEFDCSFRGTKDHYAHFSAIRGKNVKFFRAAIDNGLIHFEQINQMRTSELSLFKNQPLYFIEHSKEWFVYSYHENYNEMEGEKFDISEINLLSKYERHYKNGVLYLLRETAKARVEKVNDKVVIVEGPLLDEMTFYTPSNSDNIYIVNQEQNVLLILNTIDLTVPPAGANNHSIVGIHDGVLTMAFDGVWGRQLSTAKMD